MFVPYEDVKSMLKTPRISKKIKRSAAERKLYTSKRQAEVTPVRFEIEHSVHLHSLESVLKKHVMRCSKRTYTYAIDTPEHFLFKYSRSNALRPTIFPPSQQRSDISTSDLVQKQPGVVLTFLEEGGYFQMDRSPTAP